MNFYQILKLNKAIKNPTIKLIGIYMANILGLRHLSVRIDPSLSCNLECQMCYFSNREKRKHLKGNIKREEIDPLSTILFPKALQVVVGCGAEPTVNQNFLDIIKQAKKHGVPDVSLVTNGQLLTYANIEALIDLGLDEITLSMHGISKPVYERFMVNANYETFVEKLNWLNELKEKKKSTRPHIRINYTVNTENLEDLMSFFDIFGYLNIATLQIRPVFDNEGIYSKGLTIAQESDYRLLIDKFKAITKQRDMRLLVNTEDVHYTKNSNDARVAAAVYCYISPNTTKQLGVNWANLTYRQFMTVSKRRKSIVHSILYKDLKIASNIAKSEIV